MLKWLKKRRSKTGKAPPPPGFHTALSDISEAQSLHTKSTTKSRWKKPRSPGRQTHYRNIDKVGIRSSHQKPPSPQNNHVSRLPPEGAIREIRPLPQAVASNKNRPTVIKVESKSLLNQKANLPPVRIKPIKEPKSSPPRNVALAIKVQSQQSLQAQKTSSPVEVSQNTPIYLDTSSLLVSPPSIDTALFVPRVEGGNSFESGGANQGADQTSHPPTLIEASKSKKKHRNAKDFYKDNEGEEGKSTFNLLTSETDQANPLLSMPASYDDGRMFFTSSDPNSITEPEKVQKWMDEVNKVIMAANKRSMNESTSETAPGSVEVESSTHDKTSYTGKAVLDESLGESLEESGSITKESRIRRMASASKDFLRGKKSAKKESLDPPADDKSPEPSDEAVASEPSPSGLDMNREDSESPFGDKSLDCLAGTDTEADSVPSSSAMGAREGGSRGIVPTKYFSASRRQRYASQNYDYEDEEESIGGVSCDDSVVSEAMVHKSLRRQGYTSAVDGTTKKRRSSEGDKGLFCDRICVFTETLVDEDELCRMDDTASITDDNSLTSRSSAASVDSFLGEGCTWLDAFIMK